MSCQSASYLCGNPDTTPQMRYSLLFFIQLFRFLSVGAQYQPPARYTQGYYQWPVGAEIGLAANFGELRPNHYHMGLDCRTDQRVNLPVYAAAEGYVSKISIDGTGFGRALYINHPNGHTTLYSHLNDFAPDLEAYIRKNQYVQKTWKIQLDVPKGLFKVKKGEFIAYSGNTGGSQGPHLHFEVRDTRSDKVLNPLLMGFPIEDDIPPSLIRLALYDRRYSTYEQRPRLLNLKKTDSGYQISGGLLRVNTPVLSFALSAVDRYTGSTNQNGIYSAEIALDGETLSGFRMDSISYDDTRYLNAHIDYPTKARGGPFLQHLSALPGYRNGIYKYKYPDGGLIRLSDTLVHQVRLIVRDASGNAAELRFGIQASASALSAAVPARSTDFQPGVVNIFENESIRLWLPETALYDSFRFSGRAVQQQFQIQNTDIPVQDFYPLSVRYSGSTIDTGKMVMKMNALNRQRFRKASCREGWCRAEFRDFGLCELIRDVQAPVVTPLFGFRNGMPLKTRRIGFAVTDNTKEIASFEGWLDDTQWLLFSNDKSRNFIYTLDEYCGPGKHSLRIVVRDLVGNTTEKTFTFTL